MICLSGFNILTLKYLEPDEGKIAFEKIFFNIFLKVQYYSPLKIRLGLICYIWLYFREDCPTLKLRRREQISS